MIILIDMDDVLADFDSEFLKRWREKYPDEFYVPLEKRSLFYMKEQYPQEVWELVKEVYNSPGFIRLLPVVPGGIEAVKELSSSGYEVFICSAPLSSYENCVLEKYEWVEEHLGREWTRKLILTRDKTLVKGKLLIDDRPEIKGASVPEWEHILYDRPYNRNIKDKRRLTWRNWKEVLNLF